LKTIPLYVAVCISIGLIFWSSTSGILAQNLAYDTTVLHNLNLHRAQTTNTAMWVLGSWALGNMLYSGVQLGQNSGSETTLNFHRMNIGWNSVNLGIAALGYYSSLRADLSPELYNSTKEHFNLRTTFLVNTALDVGYMAIGAFLMEKSKNTAKKPERLKGFGQALLLNGGFLFALDITVYAVLATQNSQMKLILKGSELGLGLNF
jgi:hypothetical protein